MILRTFPLHALQLGTRKLNPVAGSEHTEHFSFSSSFFLGPFRIRRTFSKHKIRIHYICLLNKKGHPWINKPEATEATFKLKTRIPMILTVCMSDLLWMLCLYVTIVCMYPKDTTSRQDLSKYRLLIQTIPKVNSHAILNISIIPGLAENILKMVNYTHFIVQIVLIKFGSHAAWAMPSTAKFWYQNDHWIISFKMMFIIPANR